MKKTKIIVPALAVLLLSTAASVSGTVAWFSMNTQIKVTGMTVTTKVSSSLQIAVNNNEAEFSNDDIQQDRAGILEPASTIDGNTYYYTTNANGYGQANNPGYTAYAEGTALGTEDATASGKTNYDADFNDDYGFVYSLDSTPLTPDDNDGKGNGEVGFAYIDYSFYLKAYMTTSEKIILSRCNMKYDGGDLEDEHAWRVAFFAHEVSKNTPEADATTTAASGALKSILAFNESKNQNQVVSEIIENNVDVDSSIYFTDPELLNAVPASTKGNGTTAYYKASGELEPKAVNSATTVAALASGSRDTTAHKGAKAEIPAPAAAGNHYYKVVVRLWLEGEDVTCKSDTFATLTDEWSLDLAFRLGDASNLNGVQVITNNAQA